MKKLFALVVSLLMCVCVLVGCSAAPNDNYYPGASFDGFNNPSDFGNNYKYDEIVEQPFVSTSENAESYFSMDRSTSGYSLMRRQINGGSLPAPASVAIEQYINYFNYDYIRPTDGTALAAGATLFDCPWNASSKLLRIGVAAEELKRENSSDPNNIVFLIDVSGSMYGADRLPLVQQAFSMLLPMLTAKDTVSVVTYASGVKVVAEGLKCTEDNKTRIDAIVSDLTAGGSTNGEGGIQLAYACAEKYKGSNTNNRVIIATDGDFNVGAQSKEDLQILISQKIDQNIQLTVLGVGMGNYRADFMETLAKNGNSACYYIDTLNEARKVLVEEFGGTINTVAYDAKAAVKFNADIVDSYRIIGYENSLLSRDEYEDDKTNAGEIGSGHTVSAVYEVKLKEAVNVGDKVCDVEVAYKTKQSDGDKNTLVSATPVTATVTYNPDYQPSSDDVFVGCVVEFGLILRTSKYKGDATYAAITERLNSLGDYVTKDCFKAEFADLVQKAATMSVR